MDALWSELPCIDAQSWRTVSVPSALTCTTRSSRPPRVPPCAETLMVAGVPTEVVSVYPAPASLMPVPDTLTWGVVYSKRLAVL